MEAGLDQRKWLFRQYLWIRRSSHDSCERQMFADRCSWSNCRHSNWQKANYRQIDVLKGIGRTINTEQGNLLLWDKVGGMLSCLQEESIRVDFLYSTQDACLVEENVVLADIPAHNSRLKGKGRMDKSMTREQEKEREREREERGKRKREREREREREGRKRERKR